MASSTTSVEVLSENCIISTAWSWRVRLTLCFSLLMTPLPLAAVPGAISFGPGMPGTRHDYSAFLPEGHGGAHGRDEVLPVDKMLTLSRIYVAALAELDGVIE